MDWFKTALLGRAETAVWLGIKSWFADMGLSTSDSIRGSSLFCNIGEIIPGPALK